MALKNFFIWLWYTLLAKSPFSAKPVFSILILSDNTILRHWHASGSTFVHQPNKTNLETAFGLGWFDSKLNFTGKILHSTVNVEIKNPKPGQKIRIFNEQLHHNSLPLEIKAVYHDPNIVSSVNVYELTQHLAGKKRLVRDFTSIAENNAYTTIIANYLYLATIGSNDIVNVESVVRLSADDLDASDHVVRMYLGNLTDALMFISCDDEGNTMRASSALICAILARI